MTTALSEQPEQQLDSDLFMDHQHKKQQLESNEKGTCQILREARSHILGYRHLCGH